MFFPPLAFVLNNIFFIGILVVGIYFFVKFKNDKKKEIHFFQSKQPLNIDKRQSEGRAKRISQPRKTEMDLLFDIIDEES